MTVATPRPRLKRQIAHSAIYIIAVLAMVPFMLPFIWMILNSLKNDAASLAIPPVIIFEPVWDNYRTILFESEFGFHFANSLVIALGSTLLALLFGLPAAFSIARYQQRRLGTAILLTRMIPGLSVLLPWFVFFRLAGLVDTYPGVILTHLAVTLPLVIWIMIGFFEDFPMELMEAALIDGCSITGAFCRVVLPITVPGMIVAFILAFTFSWNNFLFTLIVGGPSTSTLPIIAYKNIGFYLTNFGGMAASGIVLTLPVLVLTLFVQRYIVRGLAFGGTKG